MVNNEVYKRRTIIESNSSFELVSGCYPTVKLRRDLLGYRVKQPLKTIFFFSFIFYFFWEAKDKEKS